MLLVFREIPIFTKKITSLIDDDSYAKLQQALNEDPELGDLIRASGGIRKVRWNLEHTGKSGGIRVIYYYFDNEGQIFMLLAYPKSVKDNLTDRELAVLRKLVEELKNV